MSRCLRICIFTFIVHYCTIFYYLTFVSIIKLSQGNLTQGRYYCVEKVTRCYGVYFSWKVIKKMKIRERKEIKCMQYNKIYSHCWRSQSPWVSRNSCTRWVPGSCSHTYKCSLLIGGTVLHPAFVWRDNPSFATSHPGTQRCRNSC